MPGPQMSPVRVTGLICKFEKPSITIARLADDPKETRLPTMRADIVNFFSIERS
jgi:hypothetical protein